MKLPKNIGKDADPAEGAGGVEQADHAEHQGGEDPLGHAFAAPAVGHPAGAGPRGGADQRAEEGDLEDRHGREQGLGQQREGR
jgi:hypothetical protein